MKTPRRFASAILERFVFVDSAFIGDLDEGYHGAGSALWYWRQVAGAIVFETARQIREHKLEALRALIVGWAFVWVGMHYVLHPVLGFDEWLFTRGLVRWFYMNGWGVPDTWTNLTAVGAIWFAMSGWLVARMHRQSGPSLLLAYLVFTVIVDSVAFFRSVPHPVFNPTWQIALNEFLIYPLSVLGGGVWGVVSARAQGVPKKHLCVRG